MAPSLKSTLRLTAIVAGMAGGLLLASCQEEPQAADEISQFGSYLAGVMAQQRHDDAAAARFLELAREADPENEALLHRTFAVTLLAGEMERAVDYAREIVAGNPKEGLPQMLLLADAVRRGESDAAQAALAKVDEAMNGPNFLIPLIDGWLAMDRGEIDAALESFERLHSLPALKPYADLHRALVLDLADRHDDAETHFRSAFDEADVPSFRTVELIAAFFVSRDKRQVAAEYVTKYLDMNPDSEGGRTLLSRIENGSEVRSPVREPKDGLAEAIFAFAGLLRTRNSYEEALTQARIAAYIRPDDPATESLTGGILERREQYDQAIEAYRSVAEGSPYYWQSRLAAATLLARQDKIEDSIALLRELSESRPERWDALFILGGVYRAQNKYDEALEAYRQSIKRVEEGGALERRHWRLLYAQGIAFHQAEKWPQAEEAFLRSLDLNPEEPEVMNYLAYTWVERRENLDRALEMLEDAVRLRPTAGHIVDSVGWAYFQLGQFERAVGYLERAAELMPEDPTVNDHLGDAYWRVGRRHEARFQWRRALSLNPPDEMAPGLRDKLASGMQPVGTSATESQRN